MRYYGKSSKAVSRVTMLELVIASLQIVKSDTWVLYMCFVVHMTLCQSTSNPKSDTWVLCTCFVVLNSVFKITSHLKEDKSRERLGGGG